MPIHEKEFSTPPPHPPVGTPQNSPSALPWYSIAPGTKPITHTYIEEVCTLRGGLEDISLGKSWGMGAYAYREPGMEHGPYRATKDGCLQFVKVVPVKK
ncbi:Pc21g09130 [Penicillium rubens Wisconsin 54-1255]|uniref:Pc21g09130 protein n=1 Tax=Penicillium rubens (strain ATCC 28089 / DSM 1075 / NRRL 1951 / Wisconsin 54-1255) TaxID=500485 RepID=B6HMT1_PENRW|nr:Pc21g09130 [Penicillium rubens Wisconsin 54-1255]